MLAGARRSLRGPGGGGRPPVLAVARRGLRGPGGGGRPPALARRGARPVGRKRELPAGEAAGAQAQEEEAPLAWEGAQTKAALARGGRKLTGARRKRIRRMEGIK